MMEKWNTGILGIECIELKNIMFHEINPSWIEKILTAALKAQGWARRHHLLCFSL
jgi:hypothetical protein